jgi:hypothetical protein
MAELDKNAFKEALQKDPYGEKLVQFSNQTSVANVQAKSNANATANATTESSVWI